MKLLLLLIVPLILAASIPGDGIEGCTGHESQFTLGEQQPELVATVPNGKKYTLGTLCYYLRLRRQEILRCISQGNRILDGFGLWNFAQGIAQGDAKRVLWMGSQFYCK